ncbi:aldehyde dehydrogenase domain-containing protein, partial [Xylogone sp. PMI_703]
TTIIDVKPTDTIFYEEIFALVAILTVIEDENEAIKVANNTLYGLNAAVHSRDVLAALRVTKRVEAGKVYINTIIELDEATTPIWRHQEERMVLK